MSNPFAIAADAVNFLKAVHGEAFVGFQTIFALDPPPPEWSALWYGFSAWRTDRCRGSDPSLRRS
ncbi:hypothetical protein, partial [Methylobacterium oxalidis]|uniref:hypothetical protein n=1 Tax=Methylobacterium oxalidis TaxID=944322 RepID=UPI003315DAD5